MGFEGLILHTIIVNIYGFSNHLHLQASYWPIGKHYGKSVPMGVKHICKIPRLTSWLVSRHF